MNSEQARLLKEEIRSVIDQLVLAAEQGKVGAQIRLGIECMVGVNVQKDLVKAEKWLKKGVQGLIGVQEGLIRTTIQTKHFSTSTFFMACGRERKC